MEWKCCKVVEPFTASITDMSGHYVAISMNRGKKFDYLIEGNYLILQPKGVRLQIPKSEFSMFKTIEKETL